MTECQGTSKLSQTDVDVHAITTAQAGIAHPNNYRPCHQRGSAAIPPSPFGSYLYVDHRLSQKHLGNLTSLNTGMTGIFCWYKDDVK